MAFFFNTVALTTVHLKGRKLSHARRRAEKVTHSMDLDHGPAQRYSQIQNPGLSGAFGYFHYFIRGLTFETNHKPIFPLKHIKSSRHVCNKWLMSWGTPSPSSISWGELPRNKCSVKTSHLKKTDDTCEILLAYNTTAPARNFSLVQLLKSRRPCSSVCESVLL